MHLKYISIDTVKSIQNIKRRKDYEYSVSDFKATKLLKIKL